MNTNTVGELKDLVSELGIEATFTTLEDESLIPDWAKDKYAVIARLEYQGRAIEFPYFYSNRNGDFISQGSDEFPTVSDLVWTMSTESDGLDGRTFEQWCDEFGYDSDSISKLKMYEECSARAIEWSDFINDSELESALRESGWEY